MPGRPDEVGSGRRRRRSMTGYIIRRLLWMVPVLFFVAALTFFLMHLVPGGPWDQDRKLPPGVVQNLNRVYNLDKPVPVQFALYIQGLLHGDLGRSFRGDRTVTDRLKDGLPITVTLGLSAFV